jgi:hypothetical protein
MNRRELLQNGFCLSLLPFIPFIRKKGCPTLAPPLTEEEKPKFEPPCHQGVILFDCDDPWALQWIAKNGATPLKVKEIRNSDTWSKLKKQGGWQYITFIAAETEYSLWVHPERGELIPAELFYIDAQQIPPYARRIGKAEAFVAKIIGVPYEFKLIPRAEAIKFFCWITV